MLKSLFSGVSGLQSHQVAMDVESNNIANVNTVGYKYSRANFSDLLAQTKSIATAPQGQLGGKNAVQVGLGATVNSTTRMFSQGSLQNSDKNTDIAIQGDGFFVISPDAGNTYKYTRAGDFKFDAAGNFVDNNGFIAQGWLRDPDTDKVDSTAPIQNIKIAPGLTTPAHATQEIVLKANLNSGPNVDSYAHAYKIDDAGNVTDDNGTTVPSGDMGVMFNANGEALSLKDGQGINVSYDGGQTTKTYKYNGSSALGANEFKTAKDLRKLIKDDASAASSGVKVTVTDTGKYEIDNSAGANDLNIRISAYTDSTTVENKKFTESMKALESSLPAGEAGSTSYSQAFNAATHSSGIDIFDSLGTKHTVRMAFRKTSAHQWDTTITVPNPGEISTSDPKNEKRGKIVFTDKGALSSYTPPNISFTAGNGSKANQTVNLSFGSANKFDGMTSFDSASSTSGISQDGYTGGDLVGIRIDQAGTLIGSFSNGHSFGLAQIAMAKFTNNEGLSTDGGNVYIQTANSGAPIIGTAATAGRGFIQSSALEASNVDLSRALTQLIIIQRGFQANGKTITTSDQLLQTLIGLKQ